jgi:hypothetical protein
MFFQTDLVSSLKVIEQTPYRWATPFTRLRKGISFGCSLNDKKEGPSTHLSSRPFLYGERHLENTLAH